MTYGLLALAILTEVTGTLALKQSEGFTKLGPSAIVFVSYAIAFYLLAVVLERGIPVAIAYAVWSAVGIVLVSVIGTLRGEPLTAVQAAGMLLIVVGVAALELGGRHPG